MNLTARREAWKKRRDVLPRSPRRFVSFAAAFLPKHADVFSGSANGMKHTT